MNLDPESRDALEYLEDWHRLGLTGPHRPGTSGQPHVCDEQCTTTPAVRDLLAGLPAEPTLTRQAPDPAEHAELASALTAARDGIRIVAAPTLNGVAALDELLKAAAAKPARRRRWWWLW
jgi:hypothetical protein